VGFSTRLRGSAYRSEVATLRAEMIKWMFLFWATTGKSAAMVHLLEYRPD
jgi:hypothetical protein